MLDEPELARDVVQEACLRLARERVRPEGEAARRWLFVVVRNLCLNALRSRKRRRESPLDAAVEPASKGPGPAEVLYEQDAAAAVARAVGELSPPLREVLILREYHALPYAEIAAVVDCPVGTVRSRLAAARAQLQQKLAFLLEGEL